MMGSPREDYRHFDNKGNPRILFIALVNNIGLERVIGAMAKLGAHCAVLSPPDFDCLSSRFVQTWHPIPAHRGLWLGLSFLRQRLEAVVRSATPDLLVPLDDVAAQYVRVLASSARLTPELRTLLRRSFGRPGGYASVSSRIGAMEMARSANIRVPNYVTSRDPDEVMSQAKEWGFPVVLKSENSCGGHGVTIARDVAELAAALKRFYRGSLSRRSNRFAKSVFWHSVGLRETAFVPPLLQSLAAGVPAMRTIAAWNGQVLEGASFVAVQVHPEPTGSSTIVRNVEHAQMTEATNRFVAAAGSSGFLSFDFICDPVTGTATLIEINARPIATTHLGRLFGHDVCAPLLARLTGVANPVKVLRKETRSVALFPKELVREPHRLERLHHQFYHDVPYDDPGIVDIHMAALKAEHPSRFDEIEELIGLGNVGEGESLRFARNA